MFVNILDYTLKPKAYFNLVAEYKNQTNKLNEDRFVVLSTLILKLSQSKFKINTKFQLEKLSKKLQNWHELAFGDFIKELNKAIKVRNKANKGLKPLVKSLTKKDELEWLDLFEENKQKAQDLQTQINQTDAAIDQMVYELYGLTDEKIKIVENA